nr:MAG TPA: hypothetical protein [Caudoviricetes sp.]
MPKNRFLRFHYCQPSKRSGLKVLPLQNENSYHLINFSCNVVCCVYTYS